MSHVAGGRDRTLSSRAEQHPRSKRSHTTFCPTDCADLVEHSHGSVIKKRCAECSASETPQWRQGPSGPQTLCNACGVRYSRLLRRQRSSRKRQPAGANIDTEQQDVSDTNTDCNSKDGVTIALHPLRGSSEEPHEAAGAGLHHLPLFLPEPVHRAAGDDLCPSAFFDVTAAASAAWGAGLGDSLVCEAALNLLSMSSGQRQLWSTLSFDANDAQAEPPALQPDQQARPVMGSEVLQQLLPLLTQSQLAHLKELCQQFDSLHQELVAAQAARDAVAKVLEIKQEEAKQADNMASLAAKALRQEALKLSKNCKEAQPRVKAGAAPVMSPAHLAAAAAAGCSPRKCHSPKRARLQ